MKSVILCSGRGARLNPLTEELPKPLIQIKKKTVLEKMIDKLLTLGIKDIAILTGFMEEKIEKLLTDKYSDKKIKTIYNPMYYKSNNIYSLWLAKDFVEGDEFLVINGDDITHIDILKKIISTGEANATMIDTTIPLLPDAMRVHIMGGVVKDIGKDLPDDKAFGNAIGVHKFSKEGGIILFNSIKKLLKEGNDNIFYLKAVKQCLPELNWKAIDTDRLPWTEIDDEADLKRARSIIHLIEEYEE